jgi:hypothetical protein
VSPAARRFLQPLVGIDPAAVTFVQGPAADGLTSALRADAVAVGDTVALGRAYAGDASAEGLGLLAHELTHVARRITPRFVPPVARAGRRAASAPDVDEESVALAVEGGVRAAAARGGAVETHARASAAPAIVSGSEFAEEAAAAPAAVTASASGQPTTAVDWNGLPAPWEPLPDALERPAAATEMPRLDAVAPAFAVPAVAAVAVVPAAAPLAAPAVAPAGMAMHAAGHDRTPEAPGAPASHGESPAAKPPDLDHLARQVYAVLKRRLQADAARERA